MEHGERKISKKTMNRPALDSQLIARLRADINGTLASRTCGVLPFGLPLLDDQLADGGLAKAALHEIAPSSSDLAEDAAATLFAAGIASRFAYGTGSVLWAVSRFDLYSPGLEQAGLPVSRTVFVEASDDAQVLAAMEDALRSHAVVAVVGEVGKASMTASRRLQLAASEGKCPALLLRRWRRNGVCPLSEASAAASRWRIGCVPSPARLIPGVSRASWKLELVRQRNGDPFSLFVEACDAQGRLAVPSVVADRTAATGGTIISAA